jgi:hypothetical protein
VPAAAPAAVRRPPRRHRAVRPRPRSQRPRHATITRRLSTIAGLSKYAVEQDLLDHSPAVHVRQPRVDYESHATGLDRNEVGALLVAAGLGAPAEHALISLLALNDLRVSEATGANIEAPRNCAAGGDYWDRSDVHSQGFVAVERHGRWGRAIKVPGLSALDVIRVGEVTAVSCGSAGNCAAAGLYGDHAGLQGFVAVERHGRWGKAIKVPGLKALNTGGDAEVDSVLCAPAGTCAAGGSFWDRHYVSQGFVVSRTG